MVSISSNNSSDDADENIKKKTTTKGIMKPINEIFICFGPEEFFEGDLSKVNYDDNNFDIVGQIAAFDGDQDSTVELDTKSAIEVEENKNVHITAILNKRKDERLRNS